MALANIITHADFTGVLYIEVAGTSAVALAKQSTLAAIITEYQQEVFRALFGEALYQYLTDNEGEAVYTILRDGETITIDGYKYQYRGLKIMLASFVYYYFKERKESFDSDTGEMRSENINSSSAKKMLEEKRLKAWNNGVDLYLDAIDYIEYKNNETVDYYPEFYPDYSNFAIKQNIYGI